ncbi:MAG: superoxide dismutase [Opitutales bacterium]
MSYQLPQLAYDYSALEPHIDARTMEIHHTKHHQTYVDKTNKALEAHPEWAGKDINTILADLSKLPESIRTVVRNNGGGHANHTFFWKVIGPGGGGVPRGSLASAIDQTFGSFENFKNEFTQAAINRFGSGWAWLCMKEDKSLCVCSTANQDSPVMKGVVESPGTPLIGVDVWEHAYYLKYQNKRPDYVAAFWNVVNWDQAETNYKAAQA